MKFLLLVVFLLSGLLSGCFDKEKSTDSADASINAGISINLGKKTFAKNCAICHGKAGAGLVEDWRKTLADGSYSPPPLNGTAHTWHHSPELLLGVINDGGSKIGGTMPAFKDKLTENQKLSILKYLRSIWPTDIQEKYNTRFKL